VGRYLFRRLIFVPIILFILITITFFLVRMAPGGPFSSDRELPQGVEEALTIKYDLDGSIASQYFRYLIRLLHGDLGPSLKQKDFSVNEIISNHLPPSILLGITALLISLFVGISAGLISALKSNSMLDYFTMGLAVIGISLPVFVFGPLLQTLFSRVFHILPVSGYEGVSLYLILPAITLGLPFAARFARLTRAGMLDVLSEDFITTARSKGLTERTIVLRHALKGALLPVISFLGPAIASITTGSLVVEKIFRIPGLGKEFIESALNRDYFMIMGTVILYGTLIIICNLAVDLVYGYLDPRVSNER
jgi:oligopeptide transport system permease protein